MTACSGNRTKSTFSLQPWILPRLALFTSLATDTALLAVVWRRHSTPQLLFRLGNRASRIIRFSSKRRDSSNEYFTGQRRVFDLPLEFRGTDFQRRAWRRCSTIPYGETRTYAQMARANRQSGRGTRGRRRERPQSDLDHRAVPSGHRHERRTHRVRRRARSQGLAARARGAATGVARRRLNVRLSSRSATSHWRCQEIAARARSRSARSPPGRPWPRPHRGPAAAAGRRAPHGTGGIDRASSASTTVERARRTLDFRDHDGAIERHHGARIHREQLIVEREDLRASRSRRGIGRVAVHGVDRRLKLVGPRLVARRGRRAAGPAPPRSARDSSATRSWSARRTKRRSASARASRRASMSSINASRPGDLGFVGQQLDAAGAPSRMASSQSSARISASPAVAL